MKADVSGGTTLPITTWRMADQPKPLSRRKLPNRTAYSSGILSCTVRARQFRCQVLSCHKPRCMFVLPMSIASKPKLITFLGFYQLDERKMHPLPTSSQHYPLVVVRYLCFGLQWQPAHVRCRHDENSISRTCCSACGEF